MSNTWQSQTSLARGTRPNVFTPVTPQLTGTIEVCCVGTSQTYGTAGYNDSYRLNLYNLLTSRGGLTIDMIGFQTNGTAPATKSHGVVGATVPDFNSGGLYDLGTASRNFGTTYVPDVCIVELGINDANDATLTTNFRANYVSLLTYMHTLSPNTRYLLCTVADGGDATRRGRVPTINALWSSIYSDLDAVPGLVHRPCDINVLTYIGDCAYSEAPNYLHWNDRGQLKIADALYPAVMNICGYDATW